jgi:polysaccharide biosynthesis transport protein
MDQSPGADLERGQGAWSHPGELSDARRDHDPNALGRAFKRNLPALLLWLFLCWLVAGIIIYRTPVEYVASTQVILEPLPKRKAPIDGDTSLPIALDSAQADSRIHVMKSERLLRFVFDTLDLKNSPEHNVDSPGLLHRITHIFSSERQASPQERETAAFLQFMNKVSVRRLGLSYVVEISYRASTPQQAARMANSISSAYIRDLVLSNQRDEEILQRRLADIKVEEKVLFDGVVNGKVPDHDFADANARIISAAIEPLSKSFPQTNLILVFATAIGILTGVGAIILKHNLDRTLRTRRQILYHFGISRTVVIPDVKWWWRRKKWRRKRPENRRYRSPEIVAAQRYALRPLVGWITNSQARQGNLAIGLLSWSHGEGTSSIAYALSTLLADCSQNVVLVDANFTNAALSQSLAPGEYEGLSWALSRQQPSESLTHLRIVDRIRFLPWGTGGGRDELPIGMLRMRQILKRLKVIGSVIVDLPPLSLASEAPATSSLLDGVFIVVKAGSTSVGDVTEAVLALRENGIPIFGVILNRGENIRSDPTDAARRHILCASNPDVPLQRSSFLPRTDYE